MVMVVEGERKDFKKREEVMLFLAGWLEKMSVGCFLVGLFHPAHVLGELIGEAMFFFALHS